MNKRKLLAVIMAFAIVVMAIPILAFLEIMPADSFISSYIPNPPDGAVLSEGGVGFHCCGKGGENKNVTVSGSAYYVDGAPYAISGQTGHDLWLVPSGKVVAGKILWTIADGQGTYTHSCGNTLWYSFSNENQVFDGKNVQLENYDDGGLVNYVTFNKYIGERGSKPTDPDEYFGFAVHYENGYEVPESEYVITRSDDLSTHIIEFDPGLPIGRYYIVETHSGNYTASAPVWFEFITGADGEEAVFVDINYFINTPVPKPGSLQVNVDITQQNYIQDYQDVYAQDWRNVYRQEWRYIITTDWKEIWKQDQTAVFNQDWRKIMAQDWREIYEQDWHNIVAPEYKRDGIQQGPYTGILRHAQTGKNKNNAANNMSLKAVGREAFDVIQDADGIAYGTTSLKHIFVGNGGNAATFVEIPDKLDKIWLTLGQPNPNNHRAEDNLYGLYVEKVGDNLVISFDSRFIDANIMVAVEKSVPKNAPTAGKLTQYKTGDTITLASKGNCNYLHIFVASIRYWGNYTFRGWRITGTEDFGEPRYKGKENVGAPRKVGEEDVGRVYWVRNDNVGEPYKWTEIPINITKVKENIGDPVFVKEETVGDPRLINNGHAGAPYEDGAPVPFAADLTLTITGSSGQIIRTETVKNGVFNEIFYNLLEGWYTVTLGNYEPKTVFVPADGEAAVSFVYVEDGKTTDNQLDDDVIDGEQFPDRNIVARIPQAPININNFVEKTCELNLPTGYKIERNQIADKVTVGDQKEDRIIKIKCADITACVHKPCEKCNNNDVFCCSAGAAGALNNASANGNQRDFVCEHTFVTN